MNQELVYESIRIVHTNILWQDNHKWCNISVYDHLSGELITDGHDTLTFKGKQFTMEANKDVEGFICYGPKFKLPKGAFSHLIIECI